MASDVSTKEGEESGPSNGEPSCIVDRRSTIPTKKGGHTRRDLVSEHPDPQGRRRTSSVAASNAPLSLSMGGTCRGGQPRGSVPLPKRIARRGSSSYLSHPLREGLYLRTLGGAVDSPIRTSSSKPFPSPSNRDLSFQDHQIH